MTLNSFISYIAAIYCLISFTLLCLSVIATVLQPSITAKRAKRDDQPPVSIVLPVKILEDNFDVTQESAFAQLYPNFDITVATDSLETPAVEHMRQIFMRYPNVTARVLHSKAKFAASPKVDNLYAPFMQAPNDIILMKDSNVLLEPDALAEHIRQLNDDVGLVCAIPYCAGLENFAAHIEAAIINGPHARMLFLASVLGQGHGVGKIMLFRRSDFLRMGGFQAIAHTVGEDNAMAKAMRRIGQKPVFSHRPVRQELGRRKLYDVYQRQLRWSVIRRNDELVSFLLEPICQALPTLAAALIAAPQMDLNPIAALGAAFLIWFGLETLLSIAKGWQLSYLAPAIFVVREGVMLTVWIHAWLTNQVVWAQGSVQARVAAAQAQAPKEEG